MTPSWRKPAGAFAILVLIAAWAVIVASFAGLVGGWPVLLQGVFYLAAGIAWIFPLRPLLQWIETGRWRVPSRSQD